MTKNKKTSNDIQSYIDKALDLQYAEGFHDGRHNEREKLAKSGWLKIANIEEVREASVNPCQDCVYRSDMLKIGCVKKGSCDKLEKQFLALEILEYFD